MMYKRLFWTFFSVIVFICIIAITTGCQNPFYGSYSEDVYSASTPVTIKGRVISNDPLLVSLRSATASPTKAIQNVEVWIEDLPDFTHQMTKSDGTFEFKNVPVGAHRIVAKILNGTTVFKMRSIQCSTNNACASSTFDTGDILLAKAKNVVTGVLRDINGNPLPSGTKLTLWGEPFQHHLQI